MTTTTKTKQAEPGEKTFCIRGAQLWVTIIGLLTLIIGLFVAGIALYAKFAYANYTELSASLPDGGIWMIFGFGVVLAACSVVLLLSAKFYTTKGFKCILGVFALVLTLLLLVEIAASGVLIWGLGVIALPKNEVGNAITDRLLEARAKAVNATFSQCCLGPNKPPYNFNNITSKIDAVCLWPDSAPAVKTSCGGVNVLVCVCESATRYGASFGLFLQSNLVWVAVVTIVFAVLLLFGLIATCVLIFGEKKSVDKSGAMYSDE